MCLTDLRALSSDNMTEGVYELPSTRHMLKYGGVIKKNKTKTIQENQVSEAQQFFSLQLP